MMTNKRQSNIELLRIVLMVFIVLHHFIVHAAEPGLLSTNDIDTSIAVGALLNGFLYMAVNCFILISGYFGIKFKIKGLANLYLTLFFYGLIDCILSYCFGVEFNIKDFIGRTILCLSHCDLWFLSCYLALYLFSPLINRGIETLSKREYLFVLILFSIANLYFGYFWKAPQFNINGYNVSQFVYLYIVGGYIKRFVSMDFIVSKRWMNLCLYLFASLFFGFVALASRRAPIPHWDSWKYNNPLLLVSAISFLLFFLSLNFSCRRINVWAKGCLSVYLVHMGRWIRELLFSFVSSITENIGSSVATEYVFLILFSIAVVFIILFFDFARRAILFPVLRKVEGIDNRKILIC